MYKKIVIALALDHGFSPKALDIAKKLINEDGQIVAVHVSEPVKDAVRLFLSEEDVKHAQEKTKEQMNKRLNDENNVESVLLIGHAGREIPDYAKKVGADCIIVGSHKPGLEDFFLGSTSARVVRHAQCAVHVLR